MEPSHSAGMSVDDNPVVDLLSTQLTTVDLFKRTNYTVSDLGQLQAADKDLSPRIQYIYHGILPVSQKHSRRLLLESSEYVVIDGVLLKSRTAKSKRTKNMSHFQIVLPDVMIKTIIELYHDSHMGGHSGIQDTLDRVREHYFFKKMGQKVADYIRSCLECQKRKQTKLPTRSGITAFRTPSAPFQVWEIDLYGPLSLSRQGSKYIFTAVDLFSKYIYAETIAAKDAVTVSTALIHLFSLSGVCQTLISDNGSAFIAEVTRLVCSQHNIPQQFTPSYVHHCLGACERTHRTLAEKLTPYVHDHFSNWESFLPMIVFSMNNAVHSTTQYSPFEIVFSHRPQFPLSGVLDPDLNSISPDVQQYVQMCSKQIQTVRAQVHDNVRQSQLKMVSRYSSGVQPLNLQSGDYVFLSTEPTGHGQKLQHKFEGPYVVHRLSSPQMVIIKDPNTNMCLKDAVHIDLLKMVNQHLLHIVWTVFKRRDKLRLFQWIWRCTISKWVHKVEVFIAHHHPQNQSYPNLFPSDPSVPFGNQCVTETLPVYLRISFLRQIGLVVTRLNALWVKNKLTMTYSTKLLCVVNLHTNHFGFRVKILMQKL